MISLYGIKKKFLAKDAYEEKVILYSGWFSIMESKVWSSKF